MSPYRIKPKTFRILLVGTRYDEFTLEEAGFRLPGSPQRSLDEDDMLTGRWLQHLEMDNVFTAAESSTETLKLMEKERFDIVICDYLVGTESSIDLSGKIKAIRPDALLTLLTSNPRYSGPSETWPRRGSFDLVLTWHGNGQLLRSIVLINKDRCGKSEGRKCEEYEPRVIMLVEDEPGLAGLYLPLIHEEIFNRMREILPEKPPEDLLEKILAERPRLLYATSYEEAAAIVDEAGEDLLGVITDVQFPREGRLDRAAGLELARHIRKLYPTIPIAIQSRDPEAGHMARALNAQFLVKDQMKLLSKLKRFMLYYLGFGPFIFRCPDGSEVGRAENLRELARAIEQCPIESYLYHAGNNHFSAWLALHGYRKLAVMLAPQKAYGEKDRRETVEIIRKFIEETFPDRCIYY